jgi:hypothetical protein
MDAQGCTESIMVGEVLEGVREGMHMVKEGQVRGHMVVLGHQKG